MGAFKIVGGVGTPIMLDEDNKNRSFGHHARVLIDIDVSLRLFDEITVEREVFSF